MKSSVIKKSFSIFIALVMLLTMVPAAVFAAEDNQPTVMQFTAASAGDFHATAYYTKVYSVTYLDSIDAQAMNGAVAKWDISANTGSGEVMSWIYLNEEATAAAGADRYDVYIAGEGGVWANPASSYMFYMFSSLEKINNPENFKTDNATTFFNAFYGCTSLKSVDFSSWNFSNVTNISMMFCRCYSLEYANLSGWDTSNVTNMKGVFDMNPPNNLSPDYSLKEVDLTGWNTSKVTTMENMFRNCEALEVLDLSSFDTSKVTTMRFMFYYCKNLKTIYAGEGWTTESIANISDGIFNCCYALIGQKDNQDENIAIYNEKHPSAYYPPAAEYAKFREEDGYLDKASNKPVTPEYTVTYKFVGDIIPEGVTAPADAVYEEGATVTVAENPSAEHYIFSGWSTDDAETENGEFVINNDVEFVGSWTKLYKLEYKYDENFIVPDGAPEIPDIEYWYAPGEDVPVYGTLYVPGYVFIGWTTDDAEIIGDELTMPANDVMIVGYFKKPVESVEILGNKDIILDKDDAEGEKLNVYVKPEDATIKDIVYQSSDESVVKVDKNGVITPVGEGTATVTVASKDDPTKSDTVTVTVKNLVEDIIVDKTEITLDKGKTDKITGTVTPDDATNKEVVYESGDEKVVKVDKDGNITAVGEGTTTITVSSKDDPDIKETVTVTVKIPVTEITAVEDFTLELGEEKNVEASVNDDATDKTLLYESGDAGVVKVDNAGNVIAVGEGTATITITSKDNPDVKETVTVKVVKSYKVTYEIIGDVKPDGVKAPDEAIYANGTEVTVEAALAANGYTFSGWSTDDAEVKDGKFTIRNDVHFVGSFSKNVTRLEIDKTVTELKPDDLLKLNVSIDPSDATDKGLIFESSDDSVITVDENGIITAVGEGTATVTVTSKDNADVKDTITITVKVPEVPVNGLTVKGSYDKLIIGDEGKIPVTVSPDNATNKEVTFKSNDESVIKVDKDGNFEAVGEGETTITVTSVDTGLSTEVTVKVKKPSATSVTVDRSQIELESGGKDKITVTVNPENADDKSVTFKSSDESIVKVDKYGNIEAVGEGTTVIVITSNSDPKLKTTVVVTVKGSQSTEPEAPDTPEHPGYTITVPGSVTVLEGQSGKLDIEITPDDGKIKPVYTSSDEGIVKVDADGNIIGVSAGTATISVDFGGGDIRVIPVTVAALVLPAKKTHYICFGKTDGIGWYEVSVNGGDFFPQGPNSTLEVEEGSILVVRVQDMWIDDEFDFYVNGSKVPMDVANTITVEVDGYMLIGALSMDVPVPDVDESLTIFQKILNFFAGIINWFKNLFKR